MATLNFNAAEVEPTQSFDVIPAGVYTAMIVDSDTAQSRAGDNMLKLEFSIVDGEFTGRKLWMNLNLWHSKDTVREIAEKQLSAICRATIGAVVLHDSQQLHGKPLKIRVTIRKDPTGAYADQNDIKGFEALEGASPALAMAAAPKAAAPKAAAPKPAASAPWSK